MDLGNIHMLEEESMRENFYKIINTEKELLHGQMAPFTKANGNMVKRVEMVLLPNQMETSTLDNLDIIVILMIY